MDTGGVLSLILGLIIFSFTITSVSIVPFIDLLYKFKFLRLKEAPKKGKVPLFDKIHDKKAGTPVGGGILLVVLVTAIFFVLFPIASHMGVYIRSAYNLNNELFVIFFSFLSFGALGFLDDYLKIFGKPKAGTLGLLFGIGRKQKFMLQWVLGFIIGWVIYKYLGISFLHIPLIGKTLNLGIFFVPFSAFVIVAFANAFNITDGLDGLACGLLLICLLAFTIIAFNNFDTPLSLFNAIWVGTLIAFLYFNIWPSRVWLGDTGALAFGSMLGVMGLLTGSIIALVIIGALFVIETVSSALQLFGWRALKRPILPLAPLHNTFLVKGWEEPKIVTRAWFAGIMLAIFGLWLTTV